jgi:hypothetical protein
MNKLFGLFLLALAFLAPDLAQAAARFAVCTTTCTWDNTSTAMWSTTSGGGTGASAPVAGDDVTLDAATCVGGTTCTITTFAGTISFGTVTWGACTASTTGCIIEAGTNNTNFTVSSGSGGAFNGSGTGTRKWNAGTGTYTLSNSNANSPLNMQTVTNDTSVFSAATWVIGGTFGVNSNQSMQLGGKSYGPFTMSGNSSRGPRTIVGANTYASMTIGAPNFINFANSTTQTITGALTITGSSSSNPVSLTSNFTETVATLSLGAASSGDWVTLRAITTSGAAAFTGTNCLNLGLNTLANAGTCTAPSGGGGGGGRIIGG